MAPKILKGSSHYNRSVDVYSFSLIMYFTFSGKLPFEDDPTIKGEYVLRAELLYKQSSEAGKKRGKLLREYRERISGVLKIRGGCGLFQQNEMRFVEICRKR